MVRSGSEMNFNVALSGGDPRSLGRTEEVVKFVRSNPKHLRGLFDCLFNHDEIVRMRTSDALEKICREQPDLLKPFTKRLLNEVSEINQPSVQWHLAQILAEIQLNAADSKKAIDLLKRNLIQFDDWIVTNLTLESLAKFAREDDSLHDDFLVILAKYQNSCHKSVQSRVRKLLKEFERGKMREVKIDQAIYLADDSRKTYSFLRRNLEWQALSAEENRKNKESINGYTREFRDRRSKVFHFMSSR